MKTIIFVTNNKFKLREAQTAFKSEGLDIELVQMPVEMDEIQAMDVRTVAKDKARKAYNAIKKPCFVNDAGWKIPALNGFPGPYMKDVTSWLTAEDWVRLMGGKKDRRANLHEVTVYIDAERTKVFETKHTYHLGHKPVGDDGFSFDSILSEEPDGLTFAESDQRVLMEGKEHSRHLLARWLKQNY